MNERMNSKELFRLDLYHPCKIYYEYPIQYKSKSMSSNSSMRTHPSIEIVHIVNESGTCVIEHPLILPSSVFDATSPVHSPSCEDKYLGKSEGVGWRKADLILDVSALTLLKENPVEGNKKNRRLRNGSRMILSR